MAAKKCKMADRRNPSKGGELMLIGRPRVKRAHARNDRWQRWLRAGAVGAVDSADSSRYETGPDAYYYYY